MSPQDREEGVDTRTVEEQEDHRPHWWQGPAFMVYHGSWTRMPSTPREWLRAFWNADIFLGKVPVLKLTVVLSWLGAIIF